MNTERSDGEHALRTWFQDGPTVMPDRVIDVVADRIAHEPQRRAWRARGRTFMTTPIKLAAGLASAVVVSIVAWQLLPGVGGLGGQPNVQPPSTALTEPTATATAIAPAPSQATAQLRPITSLPTFTVDATLPEGWQVEPSWAFVGPNNHDSPIGIAVAFLRADGLFLDPCQWDIAGTGDANQPGDVEVGPTVNDLAAALAENTAYESTAPMDVTVGGFPGKQLTLQVPPESPDCDAVSGDTEGNLLVFSGLDANGLHVQGPANRWDVSIADVDGTRLVAVVSSFPETPAEDLSAAQGILESVVITP